MASLWVLSGRKQKGIWYQVLGNNTIFGRAMKPSLEGSKPGTKQSRAMRARTMALLERCCLAPPWLS